MLKFWNAVSRMGLRPDEPDYIQQKHILLNRLALFIFLNSAISVALVWFSQGKLLNSAAAGTVLQALILLLSGLRRFHAARWIMTFAPTVALFIEGVQINPEALEVSPFQVFLVAFSLLPVVLYDVREWRKIVFSGIVLVGFAFAFPYANEEFRNPELFYLNPTPLTLLASLLFSVAIIFTAVSVLIRGFLESKRQVDNLLEQTQEQNEELTVLLKRVEEQQEDITDSIQYAKRIQQSLLPNAERFNDFPLQVGVLYQPKDIVSGDFYWMHSNGPVLHLAAVDCTGHGVPGAFMSVLGHGQLTRIFEERPDIPLNEAMEQLDANVVSSLKQNETGQAVPLDGMELSLLRIDTTNGMLSYCGARRPLWLYRRGEIEQIKGSRRPIGGREFRDNAFELHHVKLEPTDRVVVFSDGITDLLHGETKRKFLSRGLREQLHATAHLTPQEQANSIEKVLNAYCHPLKPLDDMLLILLEYDGVVPAY